MANIGKILLIVLASALAVSCGGPGGFEIRCDIEGLDSHGLEMIYDTGRGLSHTSHHPVEGKVELHGFSSEPTLVELFTLDGRLLASLVMRDGDKVKLNMRLDDPTSLRVEGQPASRDYAAFVADNDSLLRRGSDAEINRVISDYVKANPTSMASTLLLMTRFVTDGYELQADSLLSTIAVEARPPLLTGSWARALGEQVSSGARTGLKMFHLRQCRDTIARYTPALQSYALLTFQEEVKPDSVVAMLKALRRDFSRRRLSIMEISLAPDSASWRARIAPDSLVAAAESPAPADTVAATDSIATATPPAAVTSGRDRSASTAADKRQKVTKEAPAWVQAWEPGGVASPRLRRLAVARTPYYIIADSTATVRYRGTSLREADSLLRSFIAIPAEATTAPRR